MSDGFGAITETELREITGTPDDVERMHNRWSAKHYGRTAASLMLLPRAHTCRALLDDSAYRQARIAFRFARRVLGEKD